MVLMAVWNGVTWFGGLRVQLTVSGARPTAPPGSAGFLPAGFWRRQGGQRSP